MTARVSVVIPVYNAENSIGRAIESALAQDLGPLQVIAVNDGSTDSSLAVLQRYAEQHPHQVTVIDQENRGAAAARNAGAAATGCEYIAFLDNDDEWVPDKTSKMIAALDGAPDCVLAYSDAAVVEYGSRKPLGNFVAARDARAPSMEDVFTHCAPILTSTVVIRRRAFEKSGGFCEEYPAAGWEDVDFFLGARQVGPFQYLPERLVTYYRKPLVHQYQGYRRNFPTFRRRMMRYGAEGRQLVKKVRRTQTSALGFEGLRALREGRSAEARRCFACALSYRPLHLKTAMRLLRTYLPAGLARALTGRTRHLSAHES
jgi:glycosyltransferase involved in cell wall biosynthesis